MAVYITADRDAYDPKQCGHTLTVSELIEILEGFDPDASVYLKHDGGYTYGSIDEDDFWED